MTTVIMVDLGGDVELAWDSMASRAGEPIDLADPKVFVNNGTVIGAAGLLRAGSLLKHAALSRYNPQGTMSGMEWLITTLIPELQSALQGHPGIYNGSNELEVELLVVIDGEGYDIDNYWCPVRSKSGVYAIGSGSDYAKGAMAAGFSPLEALQVAADWDLGTGGELINKLASEYIEEVENHSIEVPSTVKVGFQVPPNALSPAKEITPSVQRKQILLSGSGSRIW